VLADAPTQDQAASFRAGVRAGIPFALAGAVVALSFGVLARKAGMPVPAVVAMSAIVFAGSAQFTAVAIMTAGGSLPAAVMAATLMNSRFLPMGFALGPSLPGRPLWRAAQGQTVVDVSWAMANQGDGRFDRMYLFGATAPQYVTWLAGTLVGALVGDVLGDPRALGLDAVYPAFFLALLLAELRSPRARGVALAGAAVALALVPFTPAGIPVLVASATALYGLRGPAEEA
jgi:4-azaleucine resistance transporter AzlC